MNYNEELNATRKEATAALSNSFIADILPDMPKPLAEMTAAELRQYQDDILEHIAYITKAANEAVEALEGVAWVLEH